MAAVLEDFSHPLDEVKVLMGMFNFKELLVQLRSGYE